MSVETPDSDPTVARTPRLFPSQVCFVVDDVSAVVGECVSRFGWGPFQEFTAPVDDAEYRGWRGRKVTDVALGMAGRVQVELIHVREGHDAIEAYQAKYGTGFQHLGVGCRSRDTALAHLVSLGAALHEKTDYAGLRIAFVDTPTGDSVFELLESTGERGDGPDLSKSTQGPPPMNAPTPAEVFALHRATIVTADLDHVLPFFRNAFRWHDIEAELATLRHPAGETPMKRARGRAGTLRNRARATACERRGSVLGASGERRPRTRTCRGSSSASGGCARICRVRMDRGRGRVQPGSLGRRSPAAGLHRNGDSLRASGTDGPSRNR